MTDSNINFITTDGMVVNILAVIAGSLGVIAVAVGLAGDNPAIVAILSISGAIVVGGMILASRGMSLPGRILAPSILTIAAAFIAYNRGGLYHISMLAFPIIIVLAGSLLGVRGSFIFAAIASAASALIGYADINGLSPFSETSRTGYEDIAVAVTMIFATAIVLRLIIQRLTESLREAEAYGEAQERANSELKNLQLVLEQRVTERTAQLSNRANQLEAISSVARSTAALQNFDELLPAITRLVSEKFGYYHVGIFLLDEEREFAVLRAANSEGGQRMLNRRHKLKLDTSSIVGFVASRGEPRVALDVGTDAVFFENPDLPETRSEMALPLRVRGRVIGVLDAQSAQPDAFTENDVATLAILADQVAIAIENARLFEEARQALKESEETIMRYVKQDWKAFASQTRTRGYVFDGKRILSLSKDGEMPAAQSLPQTGNLSLGKNTGRIAIPVKFRGQTIAMLNVKSKNENRNWRPDEITLLEAAAERAALALENARLVETAQRRASRERTIGEISTKIGAVSDLEAIMQTAVEELGRRIGGATEVTLELEGETE
ncbi:MAG: GAF domain-containing protein [Anaerolineales bacterium]|nr:GAF domain-containing protein [Anaerolineales bacterium]NUQ85033.1 GAF domain-containing protein [Anaerolineales bacterium]